MPNKRPTGIILIPPIFGLSLSFRIRRLLLILRGYHVRIVDPYYLQPFRRPFFPKFMVLEDGRKFEKLASRFDYAILMENIRNQLQVLEKQCAHIFILGFATGANLALTAAETMNVNSVIAWYPHIIFPPTFQKKLSNGENVHVPILMFFGENDRTLSPHTLDRVQQFQKARGNITVYMIKKVGHVFTEATPQYCIPNILWRPRASYLTWRHAFRWIHEHTKL